MTEQTKAGILSDPEIGDVIQDLQRVTSYRWYKRKYTFWSISQGNTYEEMVADLSENIWNVKAVVASIYHALLSDSIH